MSSFLQKIKKLFVSEEKKFTSLFLEELEVSNFINIRKLSTNLSLEKRYVCISRLLNSKRIKGVFLSEKSYFFSISDEKLADLRNNLKQQGILEISPLLKLWNINIKTLTPLLQHIEKGLLGGNKFYTINHLEKSIISTLSTKDEYTLEEFAKRFELEIDLLLPLINELIIEKRIDGVIKGNSIYHSFAAFEIIVSDFIEEKVDEGTLELSFDDISNELEITSKDSERFMVNYVEKNPGNLIVYPLEKKVMFKK